MAAISVAKILCKNLSACGQCEIASLEDDASDVPAAATKLCIDGDGTAVINQERVRYDYHISAISLALGDRVNLSGECDIVSLHGDASSVPTVKNARRSENAPAEDFEIARLQSNVSSVTT